VALHANVHQGLHGEGFIHAMACAGGFTTSRMNLDVDGVDWQIAHPGPKGTARSPKIEVQVKTMSTPAIAQDAYKLKLSTKHFNQIAGVGFQVPRFLTLVIVPTNPAEYAVCDEEGMRLGTAAYWLSLADQEIGPAGDGDPKSVSVLVPRCNFLSVETLTALLGGDLDGATR
jgi:uncharacterized protein DUF4365